MKNNIKILALATQYYLEQNSLELFTSLILPVTGKLFSTIAGKTASRFLSASLAYTKTVDGAIRSGIAPIGSGAKYALPKGLPEQGERHLAIEGDSHLVDGFSGKISSGYGKGVKTLLADETVGVKIGPKIFLSRMNYHFHEADKAGPHYDISVQDVPSNTAKWELNIPRGEYKGRYAFISTDKGTLVVPMADQGLALAKPNYQLKSIDWLKDIKIGPVDYEVSQKIDGSLLNFSISSGRAIFHSHREGADTYYDKLPGLEDLHNKSSFFLLRSLLPYPNLTGTIGKAEAYHPDGVSRVSGILNALPGKSHSIQKLRGGVTLYGWDLTSYCGQDLSAVPYRERRKLLEKVIKEIRLYNKNWNIVDICKPNQSPLDFYNKIIAQGLPWGEGVVIKSNSGIIGERWFKVKDFDYLDLEILPDGFIVGKNRLEGSLGALLVINPLTGSIGEIGTGFSDFERDWIWQHKDILSGAILKAKAMEDTGKSIRAGVFHSFHPDPRFGKIGSEIPLAMYAESLSGEINPAQTQTLIYQLKSAMGWKKK